MKTTFSFFESLSVTDRLSFSLIYFYEFVWVEGQMFIIEYIAELVCDTFCPADNFINITM